MKNIKNYLGMFVLLLAVMFFGQACSCNKDTSTYKITISIVDENGLPTGSAGSVGGFLSSKEYEAGSQVTLVATVNEGWDFGGYWVGTVSKNEGKIYVVTIDKDVILTAKFVRKEYNMTFFDEDGTTQLTSYNTTIRVGDNTNLPSRAKKPDTVNGGYYIFSGWVYRDTEDPYTETNFSVLKNIELKATYKKGYGITYMKKNEAGNFVSDSALKPDGYIASEKTTLPLLSVNQGYQFDGWYDNDSYTGTPIVEILANSGTSDKTFWAKVTPIEYTYTFEGENAPVNNPPLTYNIETNTITLPTPATRTGYRFDGWYSNAGFTGSKVENIAKGSTGNKTFYAKWISLYYGLNYITNGGSSVVGQTPAVYSFDTGIAALPVTTKKGTNSAYPGYTFLGWCTTDTITMTTPVITKIDPNDEAFLSLMQNDILYLYAKWGFTVKVDPNGGTYKGNGGANAAGATTGSSAQFNYVYLAQNIGMTFNFKPIMDWENQAVGILNAPAGKIFDRWVVVRESTGEVFDAYPDSIDFTSPITQQWAGDLYTIKAMWA